MPVSQQPQNSSFAKKLGGRVARANAQCVDKPIDTGNRRLPPKIKGGIAKLSAMYTKTQEDDKDGGKTPKGEIFFRASAITLWPEEFGGQKTSGMVTSFIIPLCDSPATQDRKLVPFEDNWDKFQNLFKQLSNGAMVCREDENTDPTGEKTQAFYFACMQQLTDPANPPIYIEFSTRGWTPPKKPGQNTESEEMVFETWHGLADPERVALVIAGKHPAAHVTERPPPAPQTGAAGGAQPPKQYDNDSPQHQPPQEPDDKEDLVAALVEIMMEDPDRHSDDAQAASEQLEDMAWANGWSKEHTTNAADWSQVGEMALAAPNSSPPATVPGAPAIGSKWMFTKRDKEGLRIKAIAAQEVEVLTVDANTKTCTVKSLKTGSEVVGFRDKKPIHIKWEWLESPF